MSDRKYRHRGYQDDDRHASPRRNVSDRRPMAFVDTTAHLAGVVWALPPKCPSSAPAADTSWHSQRSPPTQSCTSCGDALHSCANCTFFNTGSRFECQKPIAKRVESKTKANDCKFFKPKAVRDLKVETPGGPSNDPRAAFDALFKK